MSGQTKVICADATCKWNGDGNVCTCNRIALSYESVLTKHQGRREFRTCRMYEKDEKVVRLEKAFEHYEKATEEIGRALEPVCEEIVRQMRELFGGLQGSDGGGDEDD